MLSHIEEEFETFTRERTWKQVFDVSNKGLSLIESQNNDNQLKKFLSSS